MKTIARLVELALNEIFSYKLPESFITECVIELRRYTYGAAYDVSIGGDYIVVMGNTLMMIDMEDLDAVWHSEEVEVSA